MMDQTQGIAVIFYNSACYVGARRWWASSLDAPKRAKTLHAFAKENALKPDATQCQKTSKALS